MNIRVECYAGYHGDETPRRLFFDDRSIEVAEVIDRWFGTGHRYFKILGSDEATYILRQDILKHSWEMTMYEGASASDKRRSDQKYPS